MRFKLKMIYTRKSFSCLFCLSRQRKGVTACEECLSSLWRLEHLNGHFDTTQSHVAPSTYFSVVQPVFEENNRPTSLSLERKDCHISHAWRKKLLITMKRKMGSTTSKSSKESSVDPDERENKQAKTTFTETGHVRKQPSERSLSKTDGADGQMKDYRADTVAAEMHRTKHASGFLKGPYMKGSHASEMQQIHYNQAHLPEWATMQRNPPFQEVPFNVNAYNPEQAIKQRIPLFQVVPSNVSTYNPVLASSSTNSALVFPATHMPGLQSAQLGYPAWRSVGMPTFQPGALLRAAFPMNYCRTQSPESTVGVLSSQQQLYHSSAHTNATVPQQKQSHKSVEEDGVCDGRNKIGSKFSPEGVPVVQKSSSVAVEKKTEENGGRPAATAKEPAISEMSSMGDCGKKSEVTGLLDDYAAEIEKYRQKIELLPREWEYTWYGKIHHSRHQTRQHSRRPVEFSVMSYNILAQNLLDNHFYLYQDDGLRSLQWEQRQRQLVAEIGCHKPDIVNLQEVHTDHYFGHLKSVFEKMGYRGCYQKRTGDNRDGCVTLWKDEKFKLLRFSPVEYCRGGLLDRDNIAVIVELQPVRCADAGDMGRVDDKVVVANTHLLFNPRRGDVKLAQLMILMAEIDKHAYIDTGRNTRPSLPHSSARNLRYCPVIMTGDFNMEPQSELYKFVISGQMDYEGLMLRRLSGQEEGRHGRNVFLERNFFSPMYGVTDSCQYHTAVASRLKESHGSQGLRLPTEPTVTDHSQDASNSATSSSSCVNTEQSKQSSQMSVSTRRLCHQLNLVSAYRHRIERLGREKEVTTHHKGGRCSVDYIFYSVDSKEVRYGRREVRLRAVREGKLRLLSRYGLMSAKELDDMGGIPNETLASDHLCLIAKFLLS